MQFFGGIQTRRIIAFAIVRDIRAKALQQRILNSREKHDRVFQTFYKILTSIIQGEPCDCRQRERVLLR